MDQETAVRKKKCGHCKGLGKLNPGAGPPKFAALAFLEDHEETCNSCGGSGEVADKSQAGTSGLPGHEVIGTRQLGEWPNDDLVRLWTRVSSGIVKYGFVIEYRDLEPPRTGIFDGLKIVVDPDVGFEMQCFLLLHLFGHSVQWVAPSLEHKLGELQNTQDMKRFMRVLHDYEFEAAGFGMQLIREVGVNGLDQWYGDFVFTDWKYVEGYYETGELPEWKTCVVQDQPLIVPATIPEIRHRQVEVRFAF